MPDPSGTSTVVSFTPSKGRMFNIAALYHPTPAAACDGAKAEVLLTKIIVAPDDSKARLACALELAKIYPDKEFDLDRLEIIATPF